MLSPDQIQTNQKVTQLIFVGGLGSSIGRSLSETRILDERGGETAARAASSDLLRRKPRNARTTDWYCRNAGSPIRQACVRRDRRCSPRRHWPRLPCPCGKPRSRVSHRNVGFRSCCRRGDREGAGGRSRERFEDGARLGDRAAQPDIGLRERCEGPVFRSVRRRPFLRERGGGRYGCCRYRDCRLLAGLDRRPRSRQGNFLCFGRRRFGRQHTGGHQRQINAQAASVSRLHSTSLLP